jgi:hypothetical protein
MKESNKYLNALTPVQEDHLGLGGGEGYGLGRGVEGGVG